LQKSVKPIKERFKVKAKNGRNVKLLQFWTTSNGKGTLTVTTAKGEWRYWDVSITSANRFLRSKDQDSFYREKIKNKFEGERL
jgi:hypothetical protein